MGHKLTLWLINEPLDHKLTLSTPGNSHHLDSPSFDFFQHPVFSLFSLCIFALFHSIFSLFPLPLPPSLPFFLSRSQILYFHPGSFTSTSLSPSSLPLSFPFLLFPSISSPFMFSLFSFLPKYTSDLNPPFSPSILSLPSSLFLSNSLSPYLKVPNIPSFILHLFLSFSFSLPTSLSLSLPLFSLLPKKPQHT